MSGASAPSILGPASFDQSVDDEAWLQRVLAAVAQRSRASAGLAYVWGLSGSPHAAHVAFGKQAGVESAVGALLGLPRRWLLELHRVPRGQAPFDRQWSRLPLRVRGRAQARLNAWAGASRAIYAIVPVATRRSGLCLLLALPAGSIPGPRARETLRHAAQDIATAFALRTCAAPRRATPRANEHGIWRDLFDGKWAVLSSKRSAAASELLLARLPARGRHDSRSFTAREQQVLALALEGKSNKWIAWRIGVATATVASHMRRMSAKLGLRTRTELLSFFGPSAGE